MQITLYGDGTLPLHKQLIEKLEENGFPVLYDAIHGSDINFLQSTYPECTPHRLFLIQGKMLYFDTAQNIHGKVTIDFACSFNDDEQVTAHDWDCIIQYFKAILFNYSEPRLTRRLAKMIKPPQKVTTNLPSPTPTHTDVCYEFKKEIFRDRNIAFFQVIKPVQIIDQAKDQIIHYDKSAPYTVVVHDFDNRGYYPLFWSLFVCESWGTSFADIQFLKNLWTELYMPTVYGDFDLDEIIKTGQEESLRSVPVVYRKSIEEVLETLQSRERGTVISQ